MRDAFLPAVVGAGLVFGLGLGAAVRADPRDPPIHAGAQLAPPVRAGEPVLPQELDGRRSIRGCSVDERCARPGDLLREFEVEAFPPPGASPWIAEHAPPASRLEPGAPKPLVKRPSELRPDAPWLDQLELPDLPIKWSQTLVDYLVFYRDDPRGRAIMESWIIAQGRYRDMIVGHLRKARLPEDLLYVAMIESGYDPGDSSSAGALGVWQFMPEGGRIYGLREDRWVDERRDPLRSTIAQMDYFADLYQRFADWHIALAAFNMGYGAMLRSIARYNTNDFYRLCEYENAIPWETCLYTPKVLAAAIVGHNRALYGFDKLKVLPAEAWEEVAIPTSASLAAIARVAGVGEAELRQLNPQLRHGRTPPGETGYRVRVPAAARAEIQRRIVELESDWKNYDAYVLAHGERFEDVATTFGISVAQLRKLNDVTRDAEVEGGTVLVVPRISEDQRAKNRAKARANLHASGIDQRDGEPLLVPVPDKTAVVAGKLRVFYRVVAGDTLGGIARALGVRPSELAQWNALDPDSNLQARMVLLAWVPPEFDAAKRAVNLLDESQLLVVTRGSPEHLDLAEARTGRVRTEYVAQGKEKLADVARKFGMGSHDLARINRISYDTVLAKGQTIIVYQVADPGRSKRADEQWRKTPRARRGKLTGSHAARTASVNVPDDDPDAASDDPTGEGFDGMPDESAPSTEPAKPETKHPEGKTTQGGRSEAKQPDAMRSDAAKSKARKPDPAKPDERKVGALTSEAKAAGGKAGEGKAGEGKAGEGKKTDARSSEVGEVDARRARSSDGKLSCSSSHPDPHEPTPGLGGTSVGPITDPTQVQ
ncbi:MAG TPA: LysM peptidoglycan-binding domain-containing protein [Kofleriaceae bacterium]|jgi:membrane-bound lytic murein transglycosylase D|nr:LysM peptidoglycan-binding domain-containing protein [Kofleriaceae bacterium]